MAQQGVLRDKLVSWLEEQGHVATVDEVTDTTATVRFKAKGIGFYVRTNEGDPAFLYLNLSYTLPQNADEATAWRIAHDVQNEKKIVKIDVSFKETPFVRFAAEQLVARFAFDDVLWRCADTLIEASDAYFFALNEALSCEPAERFIEDVTAELGLVSGDQLPLR
jgi:hypoxanthine phosphoribosyltransferase